MELAISIISIIIAIVSAAFAYQSKLQAEKSNKISKHEHQKKIFDSFTKFRGEFLQQGEHFSYEVLNSLNISAHTADFYLNDSLSKQIKDYNIYANKIFFKHQMIKNLEKLERPIPPDKFEEIFVLTDKCHELENTIDSKLRNVLKI